MNLLLHLLKKDFHHLRVWLSLTWATWGLLLLHPFLAAGDIERSTPWLLAVNGAGWLMTLLTLTRLIQLDPSVGSDQFLGLRPVSRGMLIGSKFFFIGLLLVLPLFAIKVLHIALLSLNLSGIDYLLLIPGLLIPLTAIHLFLLLPALFTRRTGAAVLVLLGVVVVGFLLMLGVGLVAVGLPDEPDLPYLYESRFYVGVGVFIVSAVWAASAFAITRRWAYPALAAVALALSFPAMRYWRFNFVHALSEKRLAVSTAEQPDLSALKLAHTRKTIYGSTRINSGTANGIRFDAVEVPYEVENLPKPWFSKQESVQSIARLKNGRVLQSQQNPFVDSYQADNWLKAAAIDMLGASGSPGSITTHFWRLGLFDAFCAPSEEFEHSKAESPLAGIEGEAVFTIARPKVLNILPLQPGASATSRHTRFTIRQVSRYPGRITVKVSVETGSVPLRGESSGEQVRNTIFLMGNPKTKTYFAAELDGSSFSTGIGFYSLREERLSVNLPSSADEASFGDLRLYIVITEEARQVQLPFRLVGKDLPEGD